MMRNTLILLGLLTLGLTACAPSDAGNDSAEVDEASFLEQSVAKDVMNALESGAPQGTEAGFNYLSFDPGAMVVNESGDGLREIDELAAVMNANPNLNVEIRAYVDASNSGSADPQRIANMRTFFIKSRLIDNGVSPQLIETEGVVVESPQENRLSVRVLGE